MSTCTYPPEHNSTQRAQVDSPHATPITEEAQKIPRFDGQGREFCHVCASYEFIGHFHKPQPTKEFGDVRIKLSPEYIQDKVMEIDKYLASCRLELGHLINHTIKEIKESLQHLFDQVRDIRELRYQTSQNEGCTRAKVENDLMPKMDVVFDKLEKLEGYMTMEDRVTASDVLLRLTELETNVDFEKAKELIYQGAQTHATILKLQSRLKELENRFDDVCKNFDANRVIIHREPFKCPVCRGVGKLAIDEQTEILDQYRPDLSKKLGNYDKCHSCSGKGIVWA